MATRSSTTKDTSTEKAAPEEKKEAELEDLVDTLGTEPSELDKASLDTNGSVAATQPGSDVEPDEVLPDTKPDLLVDPGDGAGLPAGDQPEPSGHESAGSSDSVSGSPADHTDVDPAELGLDTASLGPSVEDLIDSGPDVGGLDGRNDGGDGYSGPGQPGPNSEEEAAGLSDPRDSAGDSLHDLNIDKINNILDSDLSDADKQTELDALADDIHEYQNPSDTSGEEPDGGTPDPNEADGGTGEPKRTKRTATIQSSLTGLGRVWAPSVAAMV